MPAECPDNTYGSDREPCSANCKTLPCDKFSATGVCTGGCVTGYSGEACRECKVLFINLFFFMCMEKVTMAQFYFSKYYFINYNFMQVDKLQ